LVWNSLTTQSISLDSISGGMKSGSHLKGFAELKAYPEKGYYYAIFEDLYPSQGDYDFNDVMLETKLYLDGIRGGVWGTVNTTVHHVGGSLNTKIGLMFYMVKDKNEYTRIPNSQIRINGNSLSETNQDKPFTMDLPASGTNFEVDYVVRDRTITTNQIWISWFIMTEQQKEWTEIHTSGFPNSSIKSFEIPHREYLTAGNLPWGLEIVAEKFSIPQERAFFLDVFPEFKDWAESGGVKNISWFENPNEKLTQ